MATKVANPPTAHPPSTGTTGPVGTTTGTVGTKMASPSFLPIPGFLGLNHPHGGFGTPCPWSTAGASWFPALPIGLPFGGHLWPPAVMSSVMTTFPEYRRLIKSVQTEVEDVKNTTRNAYEDYFNFISHDMMALPWRPLNLFEYYAQSNPIRIDNRDGSRMLCMCFDLGGMFRPEEVKVSFSRAERAIICEAGLEFGGAPNKGERQHQVSRHYYRKYVLPEGIDYSKVDFKSNIRPDGIVCVDAALPRMTEDELKQYRAGTIKPSGAPSSLLTSTSNYTPVPIRTVIA